MVTPRPLRRVPGVVIPEAPATAGSVAALDPLVTVWPAGEPIHRCFDVAWGSRDLYPADDQRRGRFSPLVPLEADGALPVLYGAGDEIGALSETVFHDVPVRGTKQVSYRYLRHRLLVPLASQRDLALVDLTSHGLSRLGLAHSELIESGSRFYPATAEWARALHAHPAEVDGLVWISRQSNTSRALVLFGDRVSVDDLVVVPDRVPMTVGAGSGLALTLEVADRAGITITGLDG